jgi:hypothetical protein
MVIINSYVKLPEGNGRFHRKPGGNCCQSNGGDGEPKAWVLQIIMSAPLANEVNDVMKISAQYDPIMPYIYIFIYLNN